MLKYIIDILVLAIIPMLTFDMLLMKGMSMLRTDAEREADDEAQLKFIREYNARKILH